MKNKLAALSFLYLVLPLLFIPLWAYVNGSWLMLFGILGSYFGSLCYFQDFGAVLFVLFLALIVYFALLRGAFDYKDIFAFIFLCMFYGFATAAIYKREKEMQKMQQEIEDINNHN